MLSIARRRTFEQVLADRRLGPDEPIVLAIHVANPRVQYADRGKSLIVGSCTSDIEKAIDSVGKSWTKQRKAEERHASACKRRDQIYRPRSKDIKEICFENMEKAYMRASDDGSLPTPWRQVGYVMRQIVDAHPQASRPLKLTTFKQYIDEYLETYEPGWTSSAAPRRVQGAAHRPSRSGDVDDGRPQLPGRRPASLQARRPRVTLPDARLAQPIRRDPDLRERRRGFDELFAAARIPARYDIALMSTKGISVRAARALAQGADVPFFTLHDFDKNGFVLPGTFPGAIDLGLRIDDIDEYDLEAEEQKHENPTKDRLNLLKNGATEDEADFIAFGGQRVELNMFTARDLVNYVAGKLDEHGVEKVIPDDATLAQAWARAHDVRRVNGAIDSLYSGPRITLKGFYADVPPMPDQLRARIKNEFTKDRTQTWTTSFWKLASQ